MNRLFPYPLLIAGLTLAWLLLTRFSLGQLLLGLAVALVAAQAMQRLQPSRPRIRRWDLVPRLAGIVVWDILRSNYDVARILLRRRSPERKSGFLAVPLDMRDETGLAILAIILTSTPGTIWLDYSAARGTLLVHVFDMVDEAHWIDLIKNRYERLLMEILE